MDFLNLLCFSTTFQTETVAVQHRRGFPDVGLFHEIFPRLCRIVAPSLQSRLYRPKAKIHYTSFPIGSP